MKANFTQKVTNWGNFPVVEKEIKSEDSVDRIKDFVRNNNEVIARGNGRCYGTNEVEFTFDNVKARNITCSCYEVGLCIHESTAVSALNGILAEIEKNKEFAEMYNKSGYIALIDKNSVIENTVNSNKTCCIELL